MTAGEDDPVERARAAQGLIQPRGVGGQYADRGPDQHGKSQALELARQRAIALLRAGHDDGLQLHRRGHGASACPCTSRSAAMRLAAPFAMSSVASRDPSAAAPGSVASASPLASSSREPSSAQTAAYRRMREPVAMASAPSGT